MTGDGAQRSSTRGSGDGAQRSSTRGSGEAAQRSSTVVGDPGPVSRVRWNADGLVCAVVQQHDTREVLMVAWMSAEALARTLDTREATYWSRSRQELWVKGATSGHTQAVREVRLDCDGDTVLVLVDQTGAACHTGERTCFDADVLLPAPGAGPSAP